MASHARHVHSATSSNRATVKFVRDDLLWDGGIIASPYDGEVISVPIEHGDYLVGPTILDMMTRQVVRWRDLPPASLPQGVDPEEHVAVWRPRESATLWPRPGQSRFRQQAPREPRVENNRKQRLPSHPFFADLASGGIPADGGPEGFVRVRKQSTVSIAEGAYRLAVAMQGGTTEATRWISDAAQKAWERDLDRALELWTRIGGSANELIEDDDVEALRPTSSVSQEVERHIMREAIRWLGVDPDVELVRPRGRPKAVAGDEGDIIRLSFAADGTVVGSFKSAHHRIAKGTTLASLDLLTLVEALGALRTDGLSTDAELLEAYLDSAAPTWREQAADAAVGSSAPAYEESPYDALGVTPETPMAEIAEAFRATMHAIQHLPNAAPQRRLIAAFKTLKALHKEAA